MSKVWFITGSSRGLGRALVETLLVAGEQVVATARNPQQLNQLQQQYPENLHLLTLDVQQADQAHEAIQAAFERFGRIDVLVNNAGYGNIAAIEQASETEFRDQIETNFWGVVNVTRAALPFLRKQGSGHILQISSIGGRTAAAGLAAYQAAKWAVEGFSAVLAQEVASFGVKVTIVEPGAMPTDWAGSSMTVTTPNADYDASVGMIVGLLDQIKQHFATSGSDLTKVAKALQTLVEQPIPPLRLLIGSDAVEMALAEDQKRLAETHQWEALSRSTDISAN